MQKEVKVASVAKGESSPGKKKKGLFGKVDLSHNKISAALMRNHKETFEKVLFGSSSVNLSFNTLGDEGVSLVWQYSNPNTIIELTLSSNNISIASFYIIVAILYNASIVSLS